MENNKFKWWGYLHMNGTIHVKRYFSQEDLIDAYESEFVHTVFQLFLAENREEAINIVKEKTLKTN